MIEVNYVAIGIGSLVMFALGAIWYSPLMFGKMWQEIMGMEKCTEAEMKKMMEEMKPAYVAQLVFTVLYVWVFAHFVKIGEMANIGGDAYTTAFWMWLGIILPLQVGATLWSQTKKKYWVKQIFVSGLYQLVSIMIVAWLLSM